MTDDDSMREMMFDKVVGTARHATACQITAIVEHLLPGA